MGSSFFTVWLPSYNFVATYHYTDARPKTLRISQRQLCNKGYFTHVRLWVLFRNTDRLPRAQAAGARAQPIPAPPGPSKSRARVHPGFHARKTYVMAWKCGSF